MKAQRRGTGIAQSHAPATLLPGKKSGTHSTGDRVGPSFDSWTFQIRSMSVTFQWCPVYAYVCVRAFLLCAFVM